MVSDNNGFHRKTMTTNCLDDGEHQQTGATATTIELLKSIFGPALLALKPEVFSQSWLALGQPALPLGADALAKDQALNESTPAGALCGATTGLMAIVFLGEATANAFLASNASLSATLVTCLGDMHAVWLKPSNRLPSNLALDGVMIISGGIVPVWHPDLQMGCFIYQRGVPIVVDLNTLVFTGRLKEFVIDWTVRELHGPPVVQASPRRKQLNPAYWGVWISKTVGIRFDTSRGLFVAPAPESNEEIVIPAANLHGVIAAMLQHARQAGADVPAHEINPQRIKEIVAALKMFCSISTPTEAEILSEFVTTKLERRPGSILSKNAATAALLEFRRSRGLQPPGNENALRRDLRLAILKLLGIRQRHDAGRWFKGLALRSTNGEKTPQHPLPKAGVACAKTNPQHPESTSESNETASNPS